MSLFSLPGCGIKDIRRRDAELQGVSGRREAGYFQAEKKKKKRAIVTVRRSKSEFKFTTEISVTQTTILDTKVYKGDRLFHMGSILDVGTYYKSTETFQYTSSYSCHPPGVMKGFIKRNVSRLPRTNSSQFIFEQNMRGFRSHLQNRDYPATEL